MRILEIVNSQREAVCATLLGKARLRPVKKMTIPKIELTAAVLAVKVAEVLEEELRVPIRTMTYWTDSTSVFLYIGNLSRRFKTFVANRVAKKENPPTFNNGGLCEL